MTELTAEHKAFHAHLDICAQCREHPFALCAVGENALRAAAASIEHEYPFTALTIEHLKRTHKFPAA